MGFAGRAIIDRWHFSGFVAICIFKEDYYIKNWKYCTKECSMKLIKKSNNVLEKRHLNIKKNVIDIVPQVVQYRSQ
jgi:hypothetical protein